MRSLLFFALSLVLTASQLCAQTLPKATSIQEYWPEGEKKVYIFTIDSTEIGRLEATHSGGGDRFREIEEELSLDLESIGLGPKMHIQNKLSVYASGYFMSSDLKATVNDAKQSLTAVFDSASGAVTAIINGDDDNPRTKELGNPYFVCDNNMIDQMELMLAFHDLVPGESFVIPIFSAQGLYTAEFEFNVIGKTVARYGRFTDSVWQVSMVRPAQQMLFIDQKHDLVRLVDRNQNLTVEFQRDPFAERKKPGAAGGWFSNTISRLPIYGLYLIVAAGWLLFLGRDSYRLRWSYLLFILGGLVYPLIYYTQAPLQQAFALSVISPLIQKGGSLYLPAVVPALLSGFIQETLKLIPLFIVSRAIKVKPLAVIALGAFVGAGFGFVEASHITGPLFQSRMLSSIAVTERVFAILFHVATGAMLGLGIARRQILQYWLITSGLHALGNYLIIFVQVKAMTIKALEIILAIYDLVLLANVILLRNKFKKGQMRHTR